MINVRAAVRNRGFVRWQDRLARWMVAFLMGCGAGSSYMRYQIMSLPPAEVRLNQETVDALQSACVAAIISDYGPDNRELRQLLSECQKAQEEAAKK